MTERLLNHTLFDKRIFTKVLFRNKYFLYYEFFFVSTMREFPFVFYVTGWRKIAKTEERHEHLATNSRAPMNIYTI